MLQTQARMITEAIKKDLQSAAEKLATMEAQSGWKALGYDSMKAYLTAEFEQPYKTLWQWMKHGAFLLQLADTNLPQPKQYHTRILNQVPEQLRVATWGYANAWAQTRKDGKLTPEVLISAGEIIEELYTSGQVTVGDMTSDANTLVNRAMDEHFYEATVRGKESETPLKTYILYERHYPAKDGKVVIELALPDGEELVVSAWIGEKS